MCVCVCVCEERERALSGGRCNVAGFPIGQTAAYPLRKPDGHRPIRKCGSLRATTECVCVCVCEGAWLRSVRPAHLRVNI